MEISDLITQIQSYYSQAEISIIKRAYERAKKSHEGQTRASGEAYIIHPLFVAFKLAELRMDIVTIAAGLLHDVVEDTGVTITDIRQEFGDKVAELVAGVSKITRLADMTQHYQRIESLRKMLLATSRDIRIIIIKLCDRLHNMQTISSLLLNDQIRIARETLDIYAPLANHLGMGNLRWQLEDLSFACLEREAYQDLKRRIIDKRKEREEYLEEMKAALEKNLQATHLSATIMTRPKHFYSIYQKMKKYNKPFEEIYDLLGLRVVTEHEKDCYAILGIVHSLWRPVPGRFKDYIGNPKSNLYKSLHTTVIGIEGKPMEVQIRTKTMDIIAEEGVAAHWRYKTGKERVDEEFYNRVTCFKRIIDWQKDSTDPKDFLESLKLDLFEDSVFVFTPKGEVKELPSSSTPIDFAYSIHTQIGDHCLGAKVNDKIVPLTYQLKSGDRVEIITSTKVHPNRDWLNSVKTAKARYRIRHWLHQLEESTKAEVSAETQEAAKPKDELPAMLTAITKKHKSPTGHSIGVVGAESLDIYLAKCCRPVPGDQIVGLISRTHGVSVHRQGCSNIHHLDPNQRLKAYWQDKKDGNYEVGLIAKCINRKDLLADMLSTIGSTQATINTAWGKSQPGGKAKCGFTIAVGNVTQLESVMKQLEKVSGVLEIQRT